MSTFKKYVFIGEHYVPFDIKSKAPKKHMYMKYIDQVTTELRDGTFLYHRNGEVYMSIEASEKIAVPAKDVIRYDRTLDPEFRFDDLMEVVSADEVEKTLEESGLDCLVAIENGFQYYWIFDEDWR